MTKPSGWQIAVNKQRKRVEGLKGTIEQLKFRLGAEEKTLADMEAKEQEHQSAK